MVPQDIVVNEWVFVAAVALVFGYVGWRRGLIVALCMLVALAIGLLFADRLGKLFEPWVNFTWKFILGVVRDRAFSPDEMIKAYSKQPKLITTDIHRMYLGTLVFLSLGAIGFLIGRKRSAKAKPPRITTRILAALVGAVNGYIAAFFLFPRYITAPKTVITMSNVTIKSLLQVQLTLPILITILVLITAGVLGTREGKPKGK